MIKVVRIAGESFDLESRKEMPKSLILSNGKREFSLYVDDVTAAVVLEMMRDSDVQPAPASPQVPSPERPVMAKPVKKPAAPVRTFEKPVAAPPMAEVEVGGSAADDDNSGFEPGEEYNDPATGAASL